jgi:integrase/recombinase XerD
VQLRFADLVNRFNAATFTTRQLGFTSHNSAHASPYGPRPAFGGKEKPMIRQLFVCQKMIARLESGPLAAHVNLFAEDLASRRYTIKTIRSYVSVCDLFGRWLAKNNIQLKDISSSVIEQFANATADDVSSRRKNWRGAALGAGRAFVRYLLKAGEIEALSYCAMPADDVSRYATAYDQYIDKVQGLGKQSRETYLVYVKRFLAALASDGAINWAIVNAQTIGKFVTDHATAHPRTCPHLVTALRSFLRFLVAQGTLPAGLEAAIPITKRFIHATLPDRLNQDELTRLLNQSKSDTTSIGVRNFAIIILLARLGLRAKEVIQLRLEDVDWAKGVLYIRSSKGKERALPLRKEVAECLVTYLKEHRPKTKHREIFITHNAPYRPMVRFAVPCHVVRKLFAKAGIERHFGKAHLLRHTLASQLINSGATFKDTADFMGHRFLQTTGIYAKLDLNSLSQIALPWPGGAK